MIDNRITRILCLMLAAIGMLQSGIAASAQPPDQPKIGLVLSGGGARGAAHIGVLKVLERLDIRPDYIAGTSMGAIIGGLYASGQNASQIEQILLHIDWDAAFSDSSSRQARTIRSRRQDSEILASGVIGVQEGGVLLPQGLLEGQKLLLILRKITLSVSQIDDFDQLQIPFRAVASDIATGRPVVIGSGDLAVAMRASMSIPALLSPVKRDGRLLVDGGVSDNLPIDVVRAMGADRVIAVDISTPLSDTADMGNLISITGQLTSIMTRTNTEQSIASLGEQDLLIVPELVGISTGDFNTAAQAIPIGQRATEAVAGQLLKLRGDARPAVAPAPPASPAPPVITFVRINNQSNIDSEIIRSRLNIALGEPLDRDQLERDIEQIYGLNLFQRVSYRLIENDRQHGLAIDVIKNPTGPNYLQGGLALEGGLNGRNSFNIGIGYKQTEINSLAGEWRSILQLGSVSRLFTELYQPLDTGLEYFINPQIELDRYTVSEFDNNDRLSELLITRLSLRLDAGKNLGQWGELRAGYHWATGESQIEIGTPSTKPARFNDGSLQLNLAVDTLDNLFFPTRGIFSNLNWRLSRKGFGGDSNYDQGFAKFAVASSFGPNRLTLSGKLGSTLDGESPVQSLFPLGGFGNLSGLQDNQLYGQNAGLLVANYYRQVNDFQLLPTYIGGTLEAGNIWDDRNDFGRDLIYSGSLYLGVDTFLGPVYLGLGYADTGQNTAFFYLGNPFLRRSTHTGW